MRTALLILLSALDDSPSRLTAGDDAFLRMEYSAAVDFYSAALDEHPNDPEILWRLARVYVCRGELHEKEQMTTDCKQAELYARRCIEADSRRPEGHCWRAAALGYIALNADRSDQVRLSHELLREVEAALSLNPNDDAAYSIKGSFYRALGNVGWLQRQLAAIFLGRIPEGGYEEAEGALKRAVAIAPDVMRHQYELGVLYLDMDRKDEARRMLEHAATLPIRVGIDGPRLAKIHELLSALSEE